MAEMAKAVKKEAVELDAAEETVIDETQSRLNDIFGGENSEQEDEATPTPGESNQEDEATPTPASKTDTVVKDDAGKENTEEVSLPDAFYHTAVRQGMSHDEIKELFEANPEVAIRVLGKIHEASSKVANDFATMGRAKLKPAAKPADAVTATEATVGKKVDLAALKEEYGADSTIVKFAEQIQASIPTHVVRDEPVSQTYGPQNQPIVQQNVALDPRVEVMVNQFFTADTLKPYKDFYGEGKDVNKLTMEQNKNRWAVLDRADEIVEGAISMGRPITPDEAMDMAHSLVSVDVQKQAMRAEFKATIQKRSKGLSLKPSQSKTVLPVKDAKTIEKDLEAAVEAKMNEIGLR